jgi:hypothetical protein
MEMILQFYSSVLSLIWFTVTDRDLICSWSSGDLFGIFRFRLDHGDDSIILFFSIIFFINPIWLCLLRKYGHRVWFDLQLQIGIWFLAEVLVILDNFLTFGSQDSWHVYGENSTNLFFSIIFWLINSIYRVLSVCIFWFTLRCNLMHSICMMKKIFAWSFNYYMI